MSRMEPSDACLLLLVILSFPFLFYFFLLLWLPHSGILFLPIHPSSILLTHLSTFVHLIVGQLHLLKGYDLLAQCLRTDGTIGMRIDACRGRGICLARHQPRTAMICIAIATRVQWNYVQKYSIAIRWLYLAQWA